MPDVLDHDQLREFAERGFVVVPRAVKGDLVARASATIDAIVEREPPGDEVRGPHFYFPPADRVPDLLELLIGSPAWACAESLVGEGALEVPRQVQVALTIPPYPHRPGLPHIDGFPPEPDGRPGTFTLLAGVLLSDQHDLDAGNLWVWPGTHVTHADYFREHGPEAFFTAGGYPPVPLPEPEQVRGRPGDLLLAHHLLGHNIGGNSADRIRGTAYFRLKRRGHDPQWREFLQDPWHDYAPARDVAGWSAGEGSNSAPSRAAP